MAAPSPTARPTPGGLALENGFSSKITLGSDPDIEFFEKSVQPPGVDGGDEIDTSTMHNTAWRTKAPGALKELTDTEVTAAYDSAVYTNIIAAVNRKDTITVTFPNGDTIAFFGYLKTFEPQEMEEGEHPEAELTIVATNSDTGTGGEEAPVITEA